MEKVEMAVARPPHQGRRFANSGILIEQGLPASRISLRANTKELAKLAKPLGLKLPAKPGTSNSKNGRSALWLGPDEWLILDNDPMMVSLLMEKLTNAKCSAVDVSHRNTAIIVSGRGAEDILNAGCPRDLSLAAFPVGGCSRTLFGKVEVILWRPEKQTFHIEVWRSFSDYLWAFLLDAAKDVSQ